MKCIIITLLCSLVISYTACQNAQPKLDAAKWQEDIRFFMDQAPRTHVNLYHSLSKAQFDSIGNDLLARVPSLGSEQIIAEMVRWVAAIGDGHSHLNPPGLHTYPILPFWFKEGFWVDNAQASGKAWIGWQLLKINGMEIEAIAQKLRPYQHHDGEQQIKAQAPAFLMTPESLVAVGLLPAVGKASFTFKNTQTGEIKTADLEPLVRADVMRLRHGNIGERAEKDAPMYLRQRDKPYWFEWLPDSKTLYFQYNTTLDDRHYSVADCVKDLDKAVEKNPVERFVVDLRWNGGGNLVTSKPFIEWMAKNPVINQHGKLFVILGRHTFSAASYFASALEFRTKAIFVGEATGASPNHYGDPMPIKLPNSGLEPRLSTIYWQNSFSWDKRTATLPSILVEPTAADFLAKRDAAFEAIMAYKAPAEKQPIMPASAGQALVGRYFLEGQLLEIREQSGNLSLHSTNFLEMELQASAQTNKFGARGRPIFVSSASAGKIKMEAFGGQAVLERLPDGFQLPHEMIKTGNVAAGVAAYRTLRQQKPDAPSVSEAEINRLGYELMNAKNMDAALALFELNTEFYPYGFNTWDSLAECYANKGDKAKAITYYKKSIALNPNNENGKRMLKALE